MPDLASFLRAHNGETLAVFLNMGHGVQCLIGETTVYSDCIVMAAITGDEMPGELENGWILIPMRAILLVTLPQLIQHVIPPDAVRIVDNDDHLNN